MRLRKSCKAAAQALAYVLYAARMTSPADARLSGAGFFAFMLFGIAILVVVLAGIPATVLLMSLAFVVAATGIGTSAYDALFPLWTALAFVFTAVEVCALSLSFKRLREVRAARQDAAADPSSAQIQ